MSEGIQTEAATPVHAFRFHVEFKRALLSDGMELGPVDICRGAFAECTGLEATMEPKAIKAGGANYGAAQRVGPVTFGTVVLKRGLTTTRHLWNWFSHVSLNGKSAYRLNVDITVYGPLTEKGDPQAVLGLRLLRALPVKLKCADLNARATEVAVEELHLSHEGLLVNQEP